MRVDKCDNFSAGYLHLRVIDLERVVVYSLSTCQSAEL